MRLIYALAIAVRDVIRSGLSVIWEDATMGSLEALRRQFEDRVAQIDGVVEGDSVFGPGPAFWVGGKEILHFDGADAVDLRLTRAEIRDRRAHLREDQRVRLRRSSSADWLEIRFSNREDVEFIVGLVEVAAATHRPPPGQVAPPPPAGADLDRRRRFH